MPPISVIHHDLLKKNQELPIKMAHEKGQFIMVGAEVNIKSFTIPVNIQDEELYAIYIFTKGGKVRFRARNMDVPPNALIFSGPHVPFQWKAKEPSGSIFFCLFNKQFIHLFRSVMRYEMFESPVPWIVDFPAGHSEEARQLVKRMLREMETGYRYKIDLLRNLLCELFHVAHKISHSEKINKSESLAADRISSQFLDLLENQFF